MDAHLELMRAVIQAMKDDDAVSSIVGQSIFDRPPDELESARYISLGPADASTDDAECVDGMEVTFQIDCWSRGPGEAFSRAESLKIAGAVRKALHEVEFQLPDDATAFVRHRITRSSRERDGITNRAIITMVALLEIP